MPGMKNLIAIQLVEKTPLCVTQKFITMLQNTTTGPKLEPEKLAVLSHRQHNYIIVINNCYIIL